MIGHPALRPLLALLLLAEVVVPQPALGQRPSAAGATDLDQFMARVLARRDDNWRKLQQYVLEEREQADLIGPGSVRLFGLVREYTWYIRDGVFVRSPLRFDGVTLGEDERRKYEDAWREREKRREERARKREAGSDGSGPAPPASTDAKSTPDDIETLVRLSREPQFVSAAYFLKFKFEPGRYAFAGPDTYENRKVLKIEYYPARLFADDKPDDADADNHRAKTDKDREVERRLERQFNKVAMVTLWIEPEAHQIVKYVFENINMDFMPGRAFVRLEDVRATMEMGQPFAGVWLPRHIDGQGGATLANGTYEVQYRVDYRDYREATTKATIR